MAREQEHGQRGPAPCNQMSLMLRPGAAADADRIVEIHNQLEASGEPLTVARRRAEREPLSPDHQFELWVAETKGRVVGFGTVAAAWWSGDPGGFAVDVRVDPVHQRQGIGSRIWTALQERLVALNAVALEDWVRADAPNGRAFAVRQGFHETGRVQEDYRLHIPAALTNTLAEREQRLAAAGLQIASLAELGEDSDDFLHRLQYLWADSGDEPPDAELLRPSIVTWRREVLDGPGQSPETHWVALAGKIPVGMTFLKRLSDDSAENDYTGVASVYRGRGIATALKLRAIRWAQAEGLAWFITSSEIGNARMITLNRRLGYEPGGRRVEVRRDGVRAEAGR